MYRNIFSPVYLGEFPEVIEGSQGIELFESKYESFMWRRVHEVKVDEIIYPCVQDTTFSPPEN